MIRLAPVLALVAVVTGILTGEADGPGPAVALLVGAIALLGLALRHRGAVGLVLAVVGCTLLGHAVMQRALHGLDASPVTDRVEHRDDVTVDATLADDPAGPRFVVHALARVNRVEGADAGGRTVLLTGDGDATSRLRVLSAGDEVRVTGTLEPLSGFDTRYRWSHAVGRLHVRELLAFASPRSRLARLANAARGAVLRGATGLPAGERALLAGFLLGDTRGIRPAVVDDFRDSGLSHLLAVSGANVAFVLALAGPVLSRSRLGVRFAAGLAILVLFGAMTRWEPSVLRASAMAAIAMTATFLGRPTSPGRLLVLAVSGLLVVDPFLVHSVGFLLSSCAAAGIVLWSARIAARVPGPRPLAEALSVTTAAQLGVLPVLIPVFGTVPLVALPANLLAAPVVGPLTIWGLIAGVVGGVLGPAAAHWLQLPTYALLRWVETVAHTAATQPVALDGRGVVGLAGLVCVGAATLRLPRRGAGRVARDAALPPR